MDFLAKHAPFLSTMELHVAPGWQTLAAWFLLGSGGLFVASRVLVFVRVLLSLFVLPGKPVCNA